VTPAGIAPVAVVVTAALGSPTSKTPSMLLSNQTAPAAVAANPPPVMVIIVPTGPVFGAKTISVFTVKVAEASIPPPPGISACTGRAPPPAISGAFRVTPAGRAPVLVVVTAT